MAATGSEQNRPTLHTLLQVYLVDFAGVISNFFFKPHQSIKLRTWQRKWRGPILYYVQLEEAKELNLPRRCFRTIIFICVPANHIDLLIVHAVYLLKYVSNSELFLKEYFHWSSTTQQSILEGHNSNNNLDSEPNECESLTRAHRSRAAERDIQA